MIIAYPNPSSGIFTVQIPIFHNGGSIQIYNLQGQSVMGPIFVHSGQQNVPLDCRVKLWVRNAPDL